MCMLRLFYYENGTWGWAEWILPYEEDIQAHIKFWKQGVRMVTTEHIDLVQLVSQVIHVAYILQGLPKMLTNEYHNK